MAYIEKQYKIKIIDWLKQNLSPSRFQHTLAVTNLACKLAAIHKCDIKQSYLAGIFHDCSKGMSDTEIKNYAKKHNLSSFPRKREPKFNSKVIPECPPIKTLGGRPNRESSSSKSWILGSPELLHSYVSAHIARTKFIVTDKDVLHAIASHTTGAANPSLLDKILYIADTASTDRTFPEAAHIRRIAIKDLELALLMAMETKVIYVLKNRYPLHPNTALTWNNWLGLGTK